MLIRAPSSTPRKVYEPTTPSTTSTTQASVAFRRIDQFTVFTKSILYSLATPPPPSLSIPVFTRRRASSTHPVVPHTTVKDSLVGVYRPPEIVEESNRKSPTDVTKTLVVENAMISEETDESLTVDFFQRTHPRLVYYREGRNRSRQHPIRINSIGNIIED